MCSNTQQRLHINRAVACFSYCLGMGKDYSPSKEIRKQTNNIATLVTVSFFSDQYNSNTEIC